MNGDYSNENIETLLFTWTYKDAYITKLDIIRYVLIVFVIGSELYIGNIVWKNTIVKDTFLFVEMMESNMQVYFIYL